MSWSAVVIVKRLSHCHDQTLEKHLKKRKSSVLNIIYLVVNKGTLLQETKSSVFGFVPMDMCVSKCEFNLFLYLGEDKNKGTKKNLRL